MDKKNPIIGISCDLSEDKEQLRLKLKYYTSVREAGGIPVIIPALSDNDFIKNIVEHVDGILLTGGPDINPVFYGEESKPYNGKVINERDETEIAIVKMAMTMGKPILGICRGAQVLNTAMGGSLYQDIYVQTEAKFNHRQTEERNCATHEVEISELSTLKNIFGETKVKVNSFHHQAVKDVAPEFRAVAHSQDGIIEAIEYVGDNFAIGVQWHPEDMTKSYPEQSKLFEAFVDKCSE